MASGNKALSLRLSERTYSGVKELAAAKGLSVNRVIEAEIEAALRRERNARLTEAFTKIAEHGRDASDIEFAFVAQSEVVLESSDR